MTWWLWVYVIGVVVTFSLYLELRDRGRIEEKEYIEVFVQCATWPIALAAIVLVIPFRVYRKIKYDGSSGDF